MGIIWQRHLLLWTEREVFLVGDVPIWIIYRLHHTWSNTATTVMVPILHLQSLNPSRNIQMCHLIGVDKMRLRCTLVDLRDTLQWTVFILTCNYAFLYPAWSILVKYLEFTFFDCQSCVAIEWVVLQSCSLTCSAFINFSNPLFFYTYALFTQHTFIQTAQLISSIINVLPT